MIGRLLLRILRAQWRWAVPFGDFNVRWLGALFGPIRPVKDFLHGKWLGHSVHALLTDLPIGVLSLTVLFDLLDMRTAADISLVVGVLGMVAAAVAGAADYTDTDDDPRAAATVHATLMVVSLAVYLVSLWLRLGAVGGDRLAAIATELAGYGLLLPGAYVGGELVFALGNMVNRHAGRFGPKSEWTKLDLTEIPENKPMAAKAGAQQLVVVRTGDTVHALHAQCAHAGGPLPSGKLVDGCIECPWHGSRFDLATGRRTRGPTTFDQPRYEVRAVEGGGWEVKRVLDPAGQNIAPAP
jgi:Ferredoxin subunits of nitrite reductase and ring-hydroxylating dioxygenases